jgi:NADP-dependent 3-hydroxy acid dehydrogenase YdfG
VKDLKGKTAYVSGAASGIGFGIASALAQAGANIAMIDIRADALTEARNRLHNLGVHVEAFVSDVSDAALWTKPPARSMRRSERSTSSATMPACPCSGSHWKRSHCPIGTG